jgi:hypothetical protein
MELLFKRGAEAQSKKTNQQAGHLHLTPLSSFRVTTPGDTSLTYSFIPPTNQDQDDGNCFLLFDCDMEQGLIAIMT